MQVCHTIAVNPKSALIVGIRGSDLVVSLLSSCTTRITALDIDSQLKPHVVGSVESLPFAPSSFDVVLCCQVLEHLPFEKFQDSLSQLKRVARTRVILSLPDVRRFWGIRLSLGRINLAYQISPAHITPPTFPLTRTKEFGHHWEIGYRGYSIKRIKAVILAAGFRIVSIERVYDLSWHTFFVLDPAPAKQ